jgi:hypothetical protein
VTKVVSVFVRFRARSHHKIYLDNDTIKNIAFENVVLLQNEAKYSNWEKYPNNSIDPEEIRC